MKKFALLVGLACAALADRFRQSGSDRGLAVNEAVAAIPGTLPPETPVVTVGIPTNLDPNKILARKKALIAAGTEPLLAEKLAIDAEQQQYLRDHHLSVTATVEERTTTEKVLVLKTHPDGEPEKVDLESLTVPKLTELAEANSIDLGGATKKADIVAAILASAKTSLVAICCALFFALTSPAQASATPDVVASAVSAAPVATAWAALDNPVVPSAFLAYLQLDVAEVTEGISALALAVAACAYLPKQYRSWGAALRYLVDRARDSISAKWRRGMFRIGMFFTLLEHRLGGRAIATNVVFTPQETSHGTGSLFPDVVVGFPNAVVVRGSDDRHFKLTVDGSEIPLGILQRDSVNTGETGNVMPKGIALFGLYPESLPAVAAAAIAADAELVVDTATPGRVKTFPNTTGTWYLIGRSRFAAAAAGDPVSIAHRVPMKVVVP